MSNFPLNRKKEQNITHELIESIKRYYVDTIHLGNTSATYYKAFLIEKSSDLQQIFVSTQNIN